MERLTTTTARPEDIVIGLTRDEFLQILVDAVVKKGLVPAEKQYDPAFFEYVRNSTTPYWITIMPADTQMAGVTCRKRHKPEE
jgi:hypothetical protein